MTNTTDEFMQSSNAPAIKFATPGEIHTITVRQVTKKIDTDLDGEIKTWKNGDPQHVFVFNGEDEGGDPASLWVRGNLVKAIREAADAADIPIDPATGRKTVINTKVTVKFTGLAEAKKGMSPAKLFAAKVEPVAPLAADGPIYGEDEPF